MQASAEKTSEEVSEEVQASAEKTSEEVSEEVSEEHPWRCVVASGMDCRCADGEMEKGRIHWIAVGTGKAAVPGDVQGSRLFA